MLCLRLKEKTNELGKLNLSCIEKEKTWRTIEEALKDEIANIFRMGLEGATEQAQALYPDLDFLALDPCKVVLKTSRRIGLILLFVRTPITFCLFELVRR